MKQFLKQIAAEVPHRPCVGFRPCIVANMHALPTVSALFQILLESRFDANNILFFGKPYSTIGSAKEEIIRAGIRFSDVAPEFPSGRLIPLHAGHLRSELASWVTHRQHRHFVLLDSGGYLTREFDAAFPLLERTSIQLTSSGSRVVPREARSPIHLGRLDVKKANESPAIANGICAEIEKATGPLHARRICVIGNGAIGRHLSAALMARNVNHHTMSGTEYGVPANADYDLIIGATGYDISDRALALSTKVGRVDLISCSSWDVEFGKLLRSANAKVDLCGPEKGAVAVAPHMIVHNAGCPVNFNREYEIEPEAGMAMTRGLTLAATLARRLDAATVGKVRTIFHLHYA